MTRIFGRYVSMEMAALCLAELLLSFSIINLTLTPFSGVTGMDVAALLACSIGAVAVAIGLYRTEICLEPRQLMVNAALVGVLAFPVGLLVSNTLNVRMSTPYMWWLAKVLLIWVVCAFAMRWAFGYAARHGWFARRIMVLGSSERAQRLRGLVGAERRRLFRLVDEEGVPGVLTLQGRAADRIGGVEADDTKARPIDPDTLRRRGVWGIVAADGPSDWPVTDLLHCKLHGIRVYDDIGFTEQHLGRIAIDHVSAERLLIGDGFTMGRLTDAVKRASDIVIALLILVITLPLMLMTALAVRLDSAGPVFYRQQRVGLYGKPFTLFKFRSMRVDAEAGGSPRWAAHRDPRITRVGAIIRSTRIDELPQLLNVLRGEMSVIGPRPERPHFVEQLTQVIPYYRERSCVKPGITGWAQVNFPYGASVEDSREKLSFDLYYVKNRTLFLDLLILIATVRVILFREGAR